MLRCWWWDQQQKTEMAVWFCLAKRFWLKPRETMSWQQCCNGMWPRAYASNKQYKKIKRGTWTHLPTFPDALPCLDPWVRCCTSLSFIVRHPLSMTVVSCPAIMLVLQKQGLLFGVCSVLSVLLVPSGSFCDRIRPSLKGSGRGMRQRSVQLLRRIRSLLTQQ